MELYDSDFRLGRTVVLAYPDDTRLAGYRAGLGLWTALAGSGYSKTHGDFAAPVALVTQPQDIPAITAPLDKDDEDTLKRVHIALATPSSCPELTFVMVNGLPKPEHVPELVDQLIGLFEKHGVESVVVPAAANISNLTTFDSPYVQLPASLSGTLQRRLAAVSPLPADACTNDAFLSAFSNIIAVSGIGDAALLLLPDKRPSGSGFRQSVVFGEDFADEGDEQVVQALAQLLVAAVDNGGSKVEIPVKAIRERFDVESSKPAMGPAGAGVNVGSDGLTAEERLYQETVHQLQKTYAKKIKPLEQAYSFEGFHSAPLTPQDIGSKPMILLLGQYSTGKTTFVEYLLGESYPGAHVGIEPTTDRFVAIMNGPEPKVIPGHAAAVSGDLPFTGLSKFGTKFLSRFQVAQLNNPLLSNLTLIDTPGILSGSKQIQRGYDFISVINWFAERSDLILLLFDGYKLDISDEFKGAIQSLRGHEDKVRIVLNKCDQISQQQLMRVYGALMWSLGKVIPTPEVNRVYLGSFWPKYKTPVGTVYEDNLELLSSEQRDLLRDLRSIPKNAAIRRVNEIVKRSRQARVHAHIIGHLRSELPSMFGKSKKAKAMLDDLPGEFKKIQTKYNLPPGDFPNPEAFKQDLEAYKIADFNKFSQRLVSNADEALSSDFPRLMQKFPTNSRPSGELGFPEAGNSSSPDEAGTPVSGRFSSRPSEKAGMRLNTPISQTVAHPPPYSALAASTSSSRNPFGEDTEANPGILRYRTLFEGICDPKRKVLAAENARGVLSESGLPTELLREVWNMADWDACGELDQVQFEVAMRICERLKNKEPLDTARSQVFAELGLLNRFNA
ncbi:hypothetical protein EV183_002482 [Coemansia sp. RSA 2336]|nr:hypothetical protein EV183_002482 [Coemansia sp. RSA 2336]